MPPSRFQKRAGSIYATSGSRDSHITRKERDSTYHAKLKEKVPFSLLVFPTSYPPTIGKNVTNELTNSAAALGLGWGERLWPLVILGVGFAVPVSLSRRRFLRVEAIPF